MLDGFNLRQYTKRLYPLLGCKTGSLMLDGFNLRQYTNSLYPLLTYKTGNLMLYGFNLRKYTQRFNISSMVKSAGVFVPGRLHRACLILASKAINLAVL
jgi:hypothetical protein